MKKTLTVEMFLTILFLTLGIIGVFLLGAGWNAWLIPMYTAVILIAYSVRWQFILPAAFMMPIVIALINFDGSFKVVYLSVLILELIFTGVFTHFSYNKWKFDIHPSLVTGILLGRFFGGVSSLLIHMLFVDGGSINLFKYTADSISGNVEGLLFQLAVIPFVVMLFNKIFRSSKKRW